MRLDAVNFLNLAEALGDNSGMGSWYLDMRTGNVEMELDPGATGYDEDEDPAAGEEWLDIDPLPGRVFHRHMEWFAARVSDRQAGEALGDALHGSGSFRRFNDTLHQRYPELVPAWRSFKQRCEADLAVEWLQDHDLMTPAEAAAYLAELGPLPERIGRDGDGMARIGLIGGMSWQSTAHYYRIINEAVAERLGGLHSARLVLISLDFAEIEELQAAGKWQEAGELLAKAAKQATDAGADLIVLCTNTMHQVAHPVSNAVAVPFLHIVHAVADELLDRGLKKVGLLGTRHLMEHNVYREQAGGMGLKFVVPSPEQQAEVDRIIYEELCRGELREESTAALRRIVASLAERGAQGVVLGCTELELSLDDSSGSPVPLFPSARIHALAAVDEALR